AARHFLRTALLAASADHYTVLGLERDATLPEIKERYRALMRLMHPDFASGSAAGAWPADAASRVNGAYETLSSPECRAAYDAQLALAPPSLAIRTTAGRMPVSNPRRRLKWLALAFGGVGALAVAAWIAGGQSHGDSLVQRVNPAHGNRLIATPHD